MIEIVDLPNEVKTMRFFIYEPLPEGIAGLYIDLMSDDVLQHMSFLSYSGLLLLSWIVVPKYPIHFPLLMGLALPKRPG